MKESMLGFEEESAQSWFNTYIQIAGRY